MPSESVENEVVSNWIHERFFVKKAKARLVIVLFSVTIGIAVDLLLIWWRTIDDTFFLNQCGRLGDMFIRFVAGLSVTLILVFSICGLYNLFASHTGKNEC